MSARVGSFAKLTDALREAPTTVPALGAIVVFVAWASDQAGYPVTHWAPGTLIVLALLGIACWTVPPRLGAVPRPVLLALACLALYTALSFLSILWANVPGDAWEGANRTLLYLLVFALFALWPLRGASAGLLLGAWTLAMIVLAAVVLLRLDARSSMDWLADEGRLTYPAGYTNASAATWMMVAWPALLLAAARRIPWALRGAFAGGAVLLSCLALLSQSRGSLYATPVMLVLIFALLPRRLRTFVVLVPVAAGVAAATPALLRVADRVQSGGDAHGALHTATLSAFVAAVVVGLVVAAGAAVEARRTLPEPTARRLRAGVAAAALAVLLVLVVGGLVAVGNPVARARHAWDTFKSPAGYAANGSGDRLTSGLGSSRYDFYRVALDEYLAHPVVGIGVDNFAEPYLQHRRSEETPHYPHSVELRALVETGTVGALLALLGLGGALLAGWRALRAPRAPPDPLVSAVAAGALVGFAYWVVHGSFDWFWEFAGLGAPAFALLGLACALAPRGRRAQKTSAALAPADTGGAARARPWIRVAGGLAGLVVVLTIVGSLTAPWLSQLQVQSAARVWRKAPASAYGRLHDAAALNPLSDEPYLVAGTIALRLGELGRAQREFSRALARTPGDTYALLELGAIASARGERARALMLLGRAARLNPRDPLTRETLAVVRRGERVQIEELNRSIFLKARRFG
jgi:O-Antigen ligase